MYDDIVLQIYFDFAKIMYTNDWTQLYAVSPYPVYIFKIH